MRINHQHSRALSPIILGLITFITGILMNIPVMYSDNVTLAGKIITPFFFVLMAILATMAARSIGIFKNNNLITSFFLFLFGGVTGYSTGYWQGFVVAVLLFYAWYSTITEHRRRGHEWNAIDASICICLASLFNIYILIMIPIIMIGLAIYGRLNSRTTLAILLGAAMIYGCLWSVAFVLGNDCELLSYLQSVAVWKTIDELRFIDMIIYGMIAINIIVSYILFITQHYNDNPLFIRKTMQFTYLTLLGAAITAVVSGRIGLLITFICVMTAIILTRRTDSLRKTAGVILLYTTTAILILLFIAKNFLI